VRLRCQGCVPPPPSVRLRCQGTAPCCQRCRAAPSRAPGSQLSAAGLSVVSRGALSCQPRGSQLSAAGSRWPPGYLLRYPVRHRVPSRRDGGRLIRRILPAHPACPVSRIGRRRSFGVDVPSGSFFGAPWHIDSTGHAARPRDMRPAFVAPSPANLSAPFSPGVARALRCRAPGLCAGKAPGPGGRPGAPGAPFACGVPGAVLGTWALSRGLDVDERPVSRERLLRRGAYSH
jgi:hypothetical protein